jgi:hypothetical protein
MDGLLEACTKTTWRLTSKVPTLQYIIHIGDAPPHGEIYGGFSRKWNKGCPCGTDIVNINILLNNRIWSLMK